MLELFSCKKLVTMIKLAYKLVVCKGILLQTK